MGCLYGFDATVEVETEELAEEIRHGWLASGLFDDDEVTLVRPSERCRGALVSAYGESTLPSDCDSAEEALARLTHAAWLACGGYVEVDARVIYVEDAPVETVTLFEDDYEAWVRAHD